jgi:drug/metabolite transporter (DMT)-like permease
MSGVLWAAAAGIGFGLFQSVNRAALRGLDAYASTFLQLLVSAVILAVAAVATRGVGWLGGTPASAWWLFAAAGWVHFLVGWTLLNLSQERLGAARTSPLLASNPLFGAVIAAFTLHELPGVRALAGMALILAGVYAVELDRLRRAARVPAGVGSGRPPAAALPAAAGRVAPVFGLGAALCWAISPILVREGLRGLPSPLLGVTIGLVAAVAAYGPVLLLRRRLRRRHATAREPGNALEGHPATWRAPLAWKLLAGVLVGASTLARWYSVALTPIAVVLSLGLLSVPTVLAVAPLLVGRHLEQVTRAVLAGSALVVAGALVLVTGR